ncbi:MAG: GNAT family N-acetyltransferase [Gammaproteobacteria bacterium]|nr:GNAT family N-acetyltransferase [Gammaproteobacteria bacterium]MYJ51334.1 GNAT family N-acetyltransferase [Gammaproteobacteria bacterium]
MSAVIRTFAETDTQSILAINAESVRMLSPMDESRFHRLREMASLVLVAQTPCGIGGFLLAFERGADYDSTNYQWFDRNEGRFLYIDRVAVSSSCRGQGIAKRFYAEAIDWARKRSLLSLVAEINVKPRNATSLSFHRSTGFREIGSRSPEPGKIVSLQKLVL